MPRYEIWLTNEFEYSGGSPKEVKLVLDSAMIEAENLSRKHNALVVVVSKNPPEPLRILGFGTKGKWKYPVACKSCYGGEYDCSACKGASWKPYS